MPWSLRIRSAVRAHHSPTAAPRPRGRANGKMPPRWTASISRPGDLHGEPDADAAVAVEHDPALDGVQDLLGAAGRDLVDVHGLLAQFVPGDGERVQRPVGGQGVGERLVDERSGGRPG